MVPLARASHVGVTVSERPGEPVSSLAFFRWVQHLQADEAGVGLRVKPGLFFFGESNATSWR